MEGIEQAHKGVEAGLPKREGEKPVEKTADQFRQEIGAQKAELQNKLDLALVDLEEIRSEASPEELAAIEDEIANIKAGMEDLDSQMREVEGVTVEAGDGVKLYGAADLSGVRDTIVARKKKEYTNEKGYTDKEIQNYSDGDVLQGLMEGDTISEEDVSSLLASLGAEGIKALREMALNNKERNKSEARVQGKDEEFDQHGGYRIWKKIDMLADDAENLAQFQTEEGAKKYAENTIQSFQSLIDGNKMLYPSEPFKDLSRILYLLQTHNKPVGEKVKSALRDQMLEMAGKARRPQETEAIKKLMN